MRPIGSVEGGVILKTAFDTGVGGRRSITHKVFCKMKALCHNIIPNRRTGGFFEFPIQLWFADEKSVA